MMKKENKVLDNELIKLLEGTPVQHQKIETKQFVPIKSSRNISSMFENEKPQKPIVSAKNAPK